MRCIPPRGAADLIAKLSKVWQAAKSAGCGPDEIVDVIRDVLRKNEAEVARIGVGYGPLPLTESHGITWQLGLNGGHVGQLYPKF